MGPPSIIDAAKRSHYLSVARQIHENGAGPASVPRARNEFVRIAARPETDPVDAGLPAQPGAPFNLKGEFFQTMRP
ncbi:hypothetical protein [Burkholderia metallica]|uniref:hypothetical protein n=1 Tax=Burkholderia metallica TaxID=488729 RepID=UPI0012F4CD5B|nr:hypothetical protein [Burkholderia metallica]MCA7999855.1 hypothetical protein [Burkholderia metallica]